MVESTNSVINCTERMWEREESVMLPTFLCLLMGWMLVVFLNKKIREEGGDGGRVTKSTLDTLHLRYHGYSETEQAF